MKSLNTALTQQKIIEIVEDYFKEKIRLIQIKNSIFEQYCIRCKDRKWIQGIWKYRVVCKDGLWHFAEIS